MAGEKDILPVFKINLNEANTQNARLTKDYTDRLIPKNTFTDISNSSLKYDNVNYISGKTYKAVVVKTYPKNTPPIPGTELKSLLNNIGENNLDNLLQCRAVIPDMHSSIDILPTNLTPEALNSDSEDQIAIDMARIFYSTGELNAAINVGAIIEVEFHTNDYSIGRIVSVIKSTSVIEGALQSALKALSDATGVPLSEYLNNTSGDGAQTNNISAPTGKCGDGKNYPYQDCKTAALDASGQTISLHPDFWEEINTTLNAIKEGENGLIIKVGESLRSQDGQLNIRKNRCPEWNGCVSEEVLKTSKWSKIIEQCKCKDKTPVAAVTGPYASNHLKGLAVDFKMDVKCPASTVDKKSYDNCRRTSKVFLALQKYATSKVINLTSEPWHWSHSGG